MNRNTEAVVAAILTLWPDLSLEQMAARLGLNWGKFYSAYCELRARYGANNPKELKERLKMAIVVEFKKPCDACRLNRLDGKPCDVKTCLCNCHKRQEARHG